MNIRYGLAALALTAMPALADTLTLQIENDAGMVTTREGYTPTECDAAALLLNGSRTQNICTTTGCGGGVITASPFINGYQTVPQPHTPKLTKAQCMRPTAAPGSGQ